MQGNNQREVTRRLNGTGVSLLITFIVCLSGCTRSQNQNPAPHKDLKESSKLAEEMKEAWAEWRNQVQRRSNVITGLAGVIKQLKTTELIPYVTEMETANAGAALPDSPDVIKSITDYDHIALMEERLSQAVNRYLEAAKQFWSESKLRISETEAEAPYLLEGIGTRIVVAKRKFVRLYLEYDRCLMPPVNKKSWDHYSFCRAVEANLAKGGCAQRYEPLVLGEVCEF